MRERYWTMYLSIKHKEYYYSHYAMRAKRFNNWITGVNLIFSTTSIASWAFWKYIPWAWAVVVIILQFIQALSPLIPFSAQLASLKFLLPLLSELTLEVDSNWRNIDEYDPKEVNKLIDKYEKQLIDLETQFIDSELFPTLICCEEKAKKDSFTYFYNHYKVKGADLNV